MSHTRYPAVAGMFYSADKQTLKHDVDTYLQQNKPSVPLDMPKAIVVPHAGYVYSGPVAASAYNYLLPFRQKIKRVILLGPSHHVAFSGMAVPESDIFNTPLGNIQLDTKSIQSILDLPYVIASDRAHAQEHSLEVQLPFLQEVLDEFSLVPIVVGDAERHDVAEVINTLMQQDDGETIVVISSDLSHYHEYNEAIKMDSATSEAIVNLQPDLISYEDACGRNGIKGMLTVAAEKKLKVEQVDLRNSGDTAGSKDRVVGYGAYVIH